MESHDARWDNYFYPGTTVLKNKLGNGCTNPFVVWCDDGQTYIVKFPGNCQGKNGGLRFRRHA